MAIFSKMDDLFGPVSTSTATTPENRWKTLAESNIIYETFGINVVPAYMEIGDIPTIVWHLMEILQALIKNEKFK